MTFSIQAGGIYKLPFPFTDLLARKARPALALNAPDASGDVRFLVITTSPVTDSTQGYALAAADYAGLPLPFPGFVHLDKPFLLHETLALKPLALLNDDTLARVFRRLIQADISRFAALDPAIRSFEPGVTAIPPSGKIIGAEEMHNMVDAALDGWLTTGRFNDHFEDRLAEVLGARHVLTTNSGSSANLLAVSALTAPSLGAHALRPGDEVITVAAGFPTTVNPILQNGCVPVFVDIDIPTYNIDATKIEAALGPRTRAIMLAHTLGNPYALDEVTRLARQHELWLIEDCCDALGSTYQGKLVGTFGDIGTLSFYPAHHITMGEGGAVFTNNGKLRKILESFRDWGRDCYCAPGCDNTCGKRFDRQRGTLPQGYDHKYTYSHLGYNLKITDMQAACGLAQLGKLPDFIARRKANFAFLKERLCARNDRLILPEATPESDPAWFGFPITLRPEAGLSRVDLLRHLDAHKIGTRLLFGGNLTRQPYMTGCTYRTSGELTNSDIVMNQTFWLGVYPGLSEEMLDYAASRIETCLDSSRVT
ncbi:lipopolysaccharide biosynthesis protein RfbH [Thiorhodococcus mannitoliphagus]|uniref:Lipopolysaccharide biosynthesis protein RfbH n=1 Tax=Thiorhodococcus mannitoliphagus TaxID=329406 RepID=A0A6P1DUC4_9GAMM|nr:lipopolysaccharide biosynthesis protein RfbH [Thiorhodococcus mannitoliphagus]NEX21698.1 lipopolysaccharide biosynthesis protein RfbH [Thiorhodococcus mannitoliphagus]